MRDGLGNELEHVVVAAGVERIAGNCPTRSDVDAGALELVQRVHSQRGVRWAVRPLQYMCTRQATIAMRRRPTARRVWSTNSSCWTASEQQCPHWQQPRP